MNADEFIGAVNERLPPGLPRADREFLRKNLVVLGSGPYYRDSVAKAISLLGTQERRSGRTSSARPPVAVSQVVVIHNSDADQCLRIREGLLQTELVNYAGRVYVNFSPFTGRTLAALPGDAFVGTDYHMEYSVFESDTSGGAPEPSSRAVNPVFFAKDLAPTLVQIFLLAEGRKQSGFISREPLPRPLYQAFLNVDAESPEAIMGFMNAHQVYLFPMSFAPGHLAEYLAGRKKKLQMRLSASRGQLTGFWSDRQKAMRDVLVAAAQGSLSRIAFPPGLPIVENAMVEWRHISGYFGQGVALAPPPGGFDHALFEFEEAETGDSVVGAKRYYGWDDYMWAELADDVLQGKAALVCEHCGRVISSGRHGGTPKRHCSREESLTCFRRRSAERARRSREQAKRL